MSCDIYPLLDILWWNLLGQWMKFVYTRGFSEYWTYFLLPRFDKGAPTWFTCGWAWASLWDDNLVDCATYRKTCRPNPAFYLHFRRVAKERFSDWVKNKAQGVVDVLDNTITNLLGSLAHSYTTFSDWLEAIRGRVGTWIPTWSTSLANASSKLFYWLPESIRGNTSSWSELWEGIKDAVKEWASLQFDAAKTWVANTAPWLITGYNLVRGWYDSVATWVTNFKDDAVGTILGWLVLTIDTWNAFWSDPVGFICILWGIDRAKLFEFFDHPVLWLYDRFDEEADEYIEILSRWVGRIVEKIIEWSWENT